MNKKEKQLCELCGKTRICEATMFIGWYCKMCHETLIEHSQEAIKAIKKQKQGVKYVL